jgi:hypothetical protein
MLTYIQPCTDLPLKACTACTNTVTPEFTTGTSPRVSAEADFLADVIHSEQVRTVTGLHEHTYRTKHRAVLEGEDKVEIKSEAGAQSTSLPDQCAQKQGSVLVVLQVWRDPVPSPALKHVCDRIETGEAAT